MFFSQLLDVRIIPRQSRRFGYLLTTLPTADFVPDFVSLAKIKTQLEIESPGHFNRRDTTTIYRYNMPERPAVSIAESTDARPQNA
jgi:hypothetical protein